MLGNLKRSLVILFSFCFLSMILVGCNQVPDNAKDLLAKVYKNMAEVSSYSMDTKLTMDTSMSGAANSISINTKIGMTLEPFELMIAHEYQDGKDEPVIDYMYTRQADTFDAFFYEKDKWNKTVIDENQIQELKEEYSTPVDFGLYFNQVDSFAITSSDHEAIVIEGTVSGSNIVNVLKNTGALKQLSLTSFPEDQLKDARPIKVKAWVNPDDLCLTKVSVDMAETYQDLTNLLFGENSLVSPQINQCIIELNHICVNSPYDITMPEDIKKELDKLL